MPLDRESIERRDFPTGRRGYEQAAVDAHLAVVAGEVEELRRVAPPRAETVAGQASEQVRAILQAAEEAAGEIRRQAEADARDHVAEVSQGSQALLGRIEAMERELALLFDSLKTGAGRVGADLSALESGVAALRHAAREPAPGEREPAPPAAPEPPPPEVEAEVPPGTEDGEGARLVALDMALNGSPREETGRYLAEHYALADSDALLDEVYATVGS